MKIVRYPDDGEGYGDYPKLKDESVELRNPYYPYDHPEFRRNFNEPIHAEIDMYSEDRYNTSKKNFPTNQQIDNNFIKQFSYSKTTLFNQGDVVKLPRYNGLLVRVLLLVGGQENVPASVA